MSQGTIVNNSKKDLRQLTVLEAEAESEKRAEQEMEKIEAMGQTSDIAARPDVRRYFKEMEREETIFKNEALEILTGLLQKGKDEYNHFLVAAFRRFLEMEAIPKKFSVYSKPTIKGIVVGIRRSRYQSAFASCFIPEYDYFACKIMALRVGNTAAKLSGFVRETQGGIILPDKEDIEEVIHG